MSEAYVTTFINLENTAVIYEVEMLEVNSPF